MGGVGEFQDWELLHNSDDDDGSVYAPNSSDYSRDFEGVEGDSEGVIRPDYFTLDSDKRYARTVAEFDDNCSDEGSVKSDNPSWVDPCSDKVTLQGITFERKNSGEFWSDSGSDGSVTRKLAGLVNIHELGLAGDAKKEVGFEGTDEKIIRSGEFGSDGERAIPVKFGPDDGEANVAFDNVVKSDLGFSSESDVVAETEGRVVLDSTKFAEEERYETPEETGDISVEPVNSGQGEKKEMVWWKLPLELLKFCVFKVSPVWSVSVAAAFVGFIILKRRLYKLKRKSQSFPLKVTIEDKKMSQLMTRATRLNEAFSVVKRVPLIHPALPAGRVTSLPVMSLR